MQKTEHLFDINKVLKNCYALLKQLRESKQIELIFEMDNHVPRELRGNDIAFQQLFLTLFTFILNNSNQKEILLTLTAPEDFMYEESISFIIKETQIPKEKVLAFLETGLGNTLELLNGKIAYDKDADIHLEIPFIIGELGFRRYYRLPLASMLRKKVLLIVESETVGTSIMHMFKYFAYDVDLGFKQFKEEKVNVTNYDLVIIDEELITETFSHAIGHCQQNENVMCVLLGNGEARAKLGSARVSSYLLKPVTQESIFDLIVSIFNNDDKLEKKNKVGTSHSPKLERHIPTIPIPESLQHTSENSRIDEIIKDKSEGPVEILNTNIGLENAKKRGAVYAKELQHFLETFDKSDLYFRQIVNEKQTNKIKDFCIALEAKSKIIGAESMQKFADIISLIFVYNKLDILPIYPGKYHIELMKLVQEIKKYLHVE